MNNVQQAEFEILKYYDQFAKKHQLKYVLYGGTLLGAIRHQGFIPWDDDIDVVMLRSEFDRFEKLFKQSNYQEAGYIFQSRQIYKNYANEFSKIRNHSIKMRERVPANQEGNYGPWVDIFALDNVPTDVELRRKQFKKVEFYNLIIQIFLIIQVEDYDKGLRKLIKAILATINKKLYKFYFFLPYAFKQRRKYITMYNHQKTELVADLTYAYHRTFENYEKNVYPRKVLENLTTTAFEGHQFPIPQDYHQVLTTLYGDYMTLPPEDERITHNVEYIIES